MLPGNVKLQSAAVDLQICMSAAYQQMVMHALLGQLVQPSSLQQRFWRFKRCAVRLQVVDLPEAPEHRRRFALQRRKERLQLEPNSRSCICISSAEHPQCRRKSST